MEPEIDIVGEAANGEEAISMVQSLSPDVILMDIRMPTINGLEATRLLKSKRVGGKVIVLSFIDDYLAQAIEAGACGYLTKDVDRDELVDAIRRVHGGELVLGRSLMSNPRVGQHIVKRLQEIAWGPAKEGATKAPWTDELGSVAEPQGNLGAAPTAEEKGSGTGQVIWEGRPPEGTTTILFSDIQGSTTLHEKLGDIRAQEILRDHNAIFREQVSSHGGFEVKSLGDGFMVAFSSARRALQCAIGVQRAFLSYNDAHTDEPLYVRIGLHTGELIQEMDDFFGKNVILASRIADQAIGGQILVSALLKELTESGGDIQFGEEREVELKGLAGVSRIYSVVWE